MNTHTPHQSEVILEVLTRTLVNGLDDIEARARLKAAAVAAQAKEDAFRASPEGIAWREEMRRRDAENNAYWREIDNGTPARPIGCEGSISAGGNSAGRGP